MRILFTIAYVGTNYFGWQKQQNAITIQEVIENKFFEKFNEKINLFASGRTDSGVHANRQFAHFDTNLTIKPNQICNALNSVLPSDIRILNAIQVDENFHARFDVKKKTYVYKTYISQTENPFLDKRALHLKNSLNLKNIKKVAKVLIGTHDFTSFCKKSSNDKDCTRTIYDIETIYDKKENTLDFKISGNGFLHNMVRIIVGTLIDAGNNKIDAKQVWEILSKKDRTSAPKTLPPYSLYLDNVEY